VPNVRRHVIGVKKDKMSGDTACQDKASYSLSSPSTLPVFGLTAWTRVQATHVTAS
jgi:hypothetical protein